MWTRFVILIGLLFWGGCNAAPQPDLRDGDIIFQTSTSSQSEALQRATGSRYTHMGIIFIENGEPYVFEAVGPVRRTALQEWVNRGVDGRFVIKRLKDAEALLSVDNVSKLRQEAENYIGLPYDHYFEWSDDRIYCSELVWKIYKRAFDIEIGQLERFSDFNLTDPVVAAKLRERFGDEVPEQEVVISPSGVFDSHLLVTVSAN